MATARLTIVVECNDAEKADAFIKSLEEKVDATIEQVQSDLDFYPEGESDEDSDEGIFVVSALSDEVASEGEGVEE